MTCVILKSSFISCDDIIFQIPKKSVVGTGKPGEAIIEAAHSEGANLIVMGSRGLNALRRTFVGSVSDYVLHHSDIPVTIVPPKA